MAEAVEHQTVLAGLAPVLPHTFIPSYLTKVGNIKRSKYYTKDEVSQHNTTADTWVTVKSNVLCISDLTDNTGQQLTPEELRPRANVSRFSGQDITHWFQNKHPFALKQCINLEHGGQVNNFAPQGLIPGVLPHAPVTGYATIKSGYLPSDWWSQASRDVGKITSKMRRLHIVNMIFCSEPVHARPDLVEVCTEEKMNEILFRYLGRNRHAGGYTWKFEGRVLDMGKTLEENGIVDDDEELKYYDVDVEAFIPVVHLYFNDDLTAA